MNFIFKILFFLFLISNVLATNKPFYSGYSLNDLEILKKDGNFEEFLQHANDIRPSERNSHWREMSNEMANQYISSKLKRKLFDRKTFIEIESLSRRSPIKNNNFFLNRRTLYGTSYLEHCFENSRSKKSDCINDFETLWNNTSEGPEKADFGIKLGHLAEKYRIPTNFWNLYSNGLKSNMANFYCNNPSVRKTLFGKLGKIINTSNSEIEIKTNMKKIIHTECWNSFVPYLKSLLSSKNKIIKEHAYILLKLKNNLLTEEKDFYLSLNLLENPVVGSIFNEAWSTMKEIGQNYKRRQLVLQKLKKLDPLPGILFDIRDRGKKNIIIEFLAQNIPEYLNFYASTCLDYLDGKKTFPNGNPTIECHQLFKSSKEMNWIKTGLQKRYADLFSAKK